MQIDLTIKNYRCFSDEKPARISVGSGFTAFVGVNNAGKSSLLKFLFEFRDLFRRLAPDTSQLMAALNGKYRPFTWGPSILDAGETFCSGNGRDLRIDIGFPVQAESEQGLARTSETLEITIPRGQNEWIASLKSLSGVDTGDRFRNDGTVLLLGESLIGDMAPLFKACEALSNTFYIGPFRNALNIGSKDDYFDIKVGQALIKAWHEFKTGPLKRSNETARRLTRDIERILGLQDLEINASNDQESLQVFVGERSYRLVELGAGLAQFFIVLANIASRNPSFILIDEPELSLHPSLQLDFLTTLAAYARDGVLFATHNIGLARATADRIYSVRKDAEGRSVVAPLESMVRLSEFLGELSFSGYRDLGFSKVLLVEGSSEIKTLQQFLRKYGKDHQVVLLPLGGGQLINESSEAELQEIRRISDDVSALIDSERSGPDTALEADRTAFREVCGRVGIKCHILQRRAIENYFTGGAVQRVLGEKYQALKPYERLSDASPSWGKSSNWRIAREMRIDDVDETDLGQFLASL